MYSRDSNALNDLSNRACVLNKTEDLNLLIFHIITGINELQTLKNHISCKCKFDGRKSNSNQKWNNHKYGCECINSKKMLCE